MNLAVLFVAASLMLVGSMIAIAVPNMVDAVPPDKPIRIYCYGVSFGGVVSSICSENGDSFNTKGECNKAAKTVLNVDVPCDKT